MQDLLGYAVKLTDAFERCVAEAEAESKKARKERKEKGMTDEQRNEHYDRFEKLMFRRISSLTFICHSGQNYKLRCTPQIVYKCKRLPRLGT